ncbi:hypothetical protein [Streptomyces sp. Rer75]|uniref:hypothetical protein n=1 Tax=Streptomyces sp. Rer75 TaxID=2750011 RepID=UPI0015CFC4DF|nr:hypothetical protein [Streptomyces sp. Rer75]QLH21543.1 hypothetical protein HYQ63_13660 [Streptomyces sp. Rer75]
MPRLLAAAVTCVLSAALAVGAALGIVALLGVTPEQPNVPLVTFPTSSGASSDTDAGATATPAGKR